MRTIKFLHVHSWPFGAVRILADMYQGPSCSDVSSHFLFSMCNQYNMTQENHLSWNRNFMKHPLLHLIPNKHGDMSAPVFNGAAHVSVAGRTEEEGITPYVFHPYWQMGDWTGVGVIWKATSEVDANSWASTHLVEARKVQATLSPAFHSTQNGQKMSRQFSPEGPKELEFLLYTFWKTLNHRNCWKHDVVRRSGSSDMSCAVNSTWVWEVLNQTHLCCSCWCLSQSSSGPSSDLWFSIDNNDEITLDVSENQKHDS